MERRAAPRELAQDRQVDRLEDLFRLGVGDVGQRREGAHPAGVRAGVSVADALVVASGREDDRAFAGGDREDRELGAFEELLDVERLLRRGERLVELGLRAADPDALAGREPVELHDARRLGAVERRCALGTPAASMTSFAKRLRALDPRGCGARPEHGDAALPQLVGEACDERRLGADDDEIDAQLERERTERRVVVGAHGMARRERGDAGIARRGMELVHAGAARERPGERVLPPPDPTTSTRTGRWYATLRRWMPRRTRPPASTSSGSPGARPSVTASRWRSRSRSASAASRSR